MDEIFLERLASILGGDRAMARKVAAAFLDIEDLKSASVAWLASSLGVDAEVAGRILAFARRWPVPALRTAAVAVRDAHPRAKDRLCANCGAWLHAADSSCAICGAPAGTGSTTALPSRPKGVGRDLLIRWQRIFEASPAPATPPGAKRDVAPRALEPKPRIARLRPPNAKPAEPKPEPELERGAPRGLQTQPPKPASRTTGETNGLRDRINGLGIQRGRTNGRVNGRGRTNGLVNGRGRVNGLVNGRGRVNGLVNGRGRVNGLVNGMGWTNGLTRRGRTNGIVNGFRAVRVNLADGVTNGVGFTNGLGGAQFAGEVRMQRWKLYTIPLVAAMLLLSPLLSLIGPGSQGPIVIDGNFQDWDPVALSSNARGQALNPNIDIVRFGITMDRDRIFVYVEVRGIVLAGGGPNQSTMDAVRVFLDIDGDAQSGYAIDGIGSDRMIEVAGHGGIIFVARVWEFDANRGPKDWGGWAKPTSTPAAVSGPRFEAQVDWLGFVDGRAVSAIAHTQAWDGQVDAADHTIAPTVGTFAVTQEPIAPVLLKGLNVPLLRLSMTSVRMPVTIDALTVRTLGTAGPPAGTLRLIDETGSELSVSVPLTRDVQFKFAPQTVAVGAHVTLVVIGDFVGGTGETFGVTVPSPSAIRTVQGIPSLRSLPGRSVGYVGEIPVGPQVDGGFAEWAGSQIDPLGDAGNANIDLRGHGVIGDGSAAYLYADVAGRLFAGTAVPESPMAAPVASPPPQPDSDRDTVPDEVDPFPFDFDNDGTPDVQEAGDYDGDGVLDYGYPDGTDGWLNATIPASFPAPYADHRVSVYIGPTNRPFVLGEDVLRFFLETDNRTSSGYAIGGIGADHVVEVRGKDGLATKAAVLGFTGSYPGDWSWTPEAPVIAATGFRAIEIVAPFNASEVYVETKDFWGGADGTVPGVARTLAAPGRKLSPPSPGANMAPNPPEPMDIGGNQKYYLRDTTHGSETACGTNKVASTTQGAGPAKRRSLNAGQDACWYLDATTGTTIPSGSWESLLDISVLTYKAHVAAFNTGTTTSTVDVVIGFQAKAMILWFSDRSETVDSVGGGNHHRGMGFGTSTTDRRAICSVSDDGAGTMATDSGHRDDAILCSQTIATGAIDGLLDISAIDADSVTFVPDDAFPADYRVHALFLGGTGLTNAATGMFNEPSATGDQNIVVTGSFQPEAVFLMSAMINADPFGIAVDSSTMFGFAAGAGNPTDVIWSGGSEDATGTSQTMTYARTGESIALYAAAIPATPDATSVDARAEVDAWNSDGFSLNWNERASTRRIHYLALDGLAAVVGDFTTSMTPLTDIVESGFGFSPSGAMFISAANPVDSADTPRNVADEWSMGAFTSTTSRGAQGTRDNDNAASAVVGTILQHDEVYAHTDTADATDALVDIQSVDTDGFTLNQDDGENVAANYVGYIAFGGHKTTLRDEIGAIGYTSNTGSGVNFPKQLDWAGSSWGTPETELATAGAAVENVRVIWDISSGSTLFWILVNTDTNIHAYKCTNADACTKEDADPGSGNDYAVTQAVGTAPERHWDATIETSSGELLLLYDNPAAVANDLCYRTRTSGSGGTWSAETCIEMQSASTNPSFSYIVLANNPGVNNIAYGAFDTTNDNFWAGMWDGSAFLTGAHIKDVAGATAVTLTNGWGGTVLAEDSSDEFVAYAGSGANGIDECEWTSTGWEATCDTTFDPNTANGNDLKIMFARPLKGTDKAMVCQGDDLADDTCWRWTGVAGTGGTRGTINVLTSADGSSATIDNRKGFAWNPDPSRTGDGLVVYYAGTSGSLSYKTYTDATDVWGAASTFTSAGAHKWIELYATSSVVDTNQVFVVTSNDDATPDILAYRWTGSGAPTNGQTITADTVDENYPYWDMAFAPNPSNRYDVRIEIWNKTTDSVRVTIGSCPGVTTGGDDVQCLASSVGEQTIASDEVVRIRVLHSGSSEIVSIDYDETGSPPTTGDSRVTLPIPEFAGIAIPFGGILLVALTARRVAAGRRGRASASNRAGSGTRVAPDTVHHRGAGPPKEQIGPGAVPGGPVTIVLARNTVADSVPGADGR